MRSGYRNRSRRGRSAAPETRTMELHVLGIHQVEGDDTFSAADPVEPVRIGGVLNIPAIAPRIAGIDVIGAKLAHGFTVFAGSRAVARWRRYKTPRRRLYC